MSRVNFHTHTSRCKHAYGKDEEYVISAIENQYKILGFSDHSCWKYNTGFVSGMRMRLNEFDGYKNSILSLKEKYKDYIEIRFGMEAEYFQKYMEWMLDFCIKEDIDYLILGNHYNKSDELGCYYGHCSYNRINDYFEDCIKGMETGMYAYLAHPELILRSHRWDENIEMGFHRICQKAKELDIPLEYNVLGLQMNMRMNKEMYPHKKFWKIASFYHNKAIIGMDAHQPRDLDAELYDLAFYHLSKYDVEIVKDIPKIDYQKIKKNFNKK